MVNDNEPPTVTAQENLRAREEAREAAEEAGDDDALAVIEEIEANIDNEEDGHLYGDALVTEQHGEGLKGAFANADFLLGTEAEIYFVMLPTCGALTRKAGKADPAQILAEGFGDDLDDRPLDTILAAAKPAEQHPDYDREARAREQMREARREQVVEGVCDRRSGGSENSSALFDLDLDDVTGLHWSFRGMNPLGHHGTSENYYVMIDQYRVGHDHKYGASYNALTHILVECGKRRAESPNGPLSDEEIYAAWKHAKDAGYIPVDDPIPGRALQYVALDADLCAENAIEDGWKLPAGAYNAALDYIRDEIGVDPGRDQLRDDADAEYIAVLPPAVRELRSATSGWDWARVDHGGSLTLDAVRERTTATIETAINQGVNALIEVLPSGGKSYSAVLAAALTGRPATIATGRGHKEQYQQFQAWCAENGLRSYRLPSFTHDCPTANGEHGDEWKERVRGWHARGATPQTIHREAEYHYGEPMPCQLTADGEPCTCPYTAKWDFKPQEYDVLIGHYVHLYKESVTRGRTILVDETPDSDFEAVYHDADPTAGPLAAPVTYWLAETDAVPIDSYEELVTFRQVAREYDARDAQHALARLDYWFAQHGTETDEAAVFEDRRAHAAAPLLTAALLHAEPVGEDAELAILANGAVAYREPSSQLLAVLQPPTDSFESARNVIGLDGTPTPAMWERLLGLHLDHRPVLDGDEERAAYIRDALGLRFVRSTEHMKSYSPRESAIRDRMTVREDAALLAAIYDEFDQKPGLITTKRAEEVYEEEGILSRYVDGVKHGGNVLGSNEFKEKRLGVVLGSRNYGPGYVKKWCAYLEAPYEATFPGAENGFQRADYSADGNQIRTHMTEHETLQAAMRFGRDGKGAVVFVHTNTLPAWVPLAGEARVLKVWCPGMKGVVEALADLSEATTAEVAAHPACEVSERQARDHLNGLTERGFLARGKDEKDGRRLRWTDLNLDYLNEYGDVDLGQLDEEEVAEVARMTTYTWDFRNPAGDDDDPPVEADPETELLVAAINGDGPADKSRPACRGATSE